MYINCLYYTYIYLYSVNPDTPIEHVYVLFEMVKAPSIFVISAGELLGVISKEGLIANMRKKRKWN